MEKLGQASQETPVQRTCWIGMAENEGGISGLDPELIEPTPVERAVVKDTLRELLWEIRTCISPAVRVGNSPKPCWRGDSG